jgi:hypothetical protein
METKEASNKQHCKLSLSVGNVVSAFAEESS